MFLRRSKCPVDAKTLCLLDMRRALIKAKLRGAEVELLTAAPPPAGRPPNIRGRVLKVTGGTVKVLLTTGPRNRIDVFSICHLIAVVPLEDDDDED